ncbi:hypothetical protein COHA_008852 [Chlorella ohadii]|uniref:TOG domain-containing protein n=1 Tax=Chlorella ohadii TaxID=2649997 RepID=A0AAD5H2U7_9CHLO|nr:hypothetical protein COHA_008852 [Chlorella ohadii]
MVQTRAQAAKSKATQSPEPVAAKITKQPRKQRSVSVTLPDGQEQAGGGAAAASGSQPQPLADKLLNAAAEAMGQKPSTHKKGLGSHPLSSLPTSPAPHPAGSPAPEFTIPAVQAQQVAQPPFPMPTLQAAVEKAASPAVQAEQQAEQQQGAAAAKPAESVEPRPAAAVQQQQQQPVAQQIEQQQEAQPPAPLPRPEKLLKPLPDKPVVCDKLPDGPEPVAVEVEYVASQDLQPVDDVAATLAAALPGLEASDWLEAVKALNLLRQLVVHHPDACSAQLDKLVPLVLKSVRSLRSSLCKTAIMAVADLYQSYGDALLPHTDVGGQAKPLTSLLAQILLKCSSNDKKFVIEEAQRALQVIIDSLNPAESLALLLPYAEQHKNPKVRGKAGGAAAAAVARMEPAAVAAYGLPRLLQAAGKLVTDNTPDARDSAKRVIGCLRAAFADPGVEAQLAFEPPAPPPAADGEEPARQPTRWEAYCQANLSGSAALAVIKASAD